MSKGRKDDDDDDEGLERMRGWGKGRGKGERGYEVVTGRSGEFFNFLFFGFFFFVGAGERGREGWI